MEILKECKLVSKYRIFAYCIMSNHVHLLLKIKKEELEQIFRRIGARYVYWYNKKYDRCGHLFHDRFKSEAVEDDAYILTVLRYIIQNPQKAGITDGPEEYEWSSHKDYLGRRG